MANALARTSKPKAYTLTHRIADEAEPRIITVINTAFTVARGLLDLPELAQAYADRWEAKILDHQQWLRVLNPLYQTLVSILSAEAQASGKQHATLLPSQVQKADPETLARVGFSFNLVNQDAVRWAEQHAARVVLGVTEETRQAIRQILVRLYQDPTMTPDRAAREIRAIIGLTRRQAFAVDNLRRALETRNRLAEQARQADTTLSAQQQAYWRAHAIRTQDQIDRQVQRAADRQLRSRANAIARTESMAASNQGQVIVWRQAKTIGLVDPTVEKEWVVAPDIRLCDICEPMKNARVPLDSPFTLEDGTTLDAPPAHPNCRCTTVLRFS